MCPLGGKIESKGRKKRERRETVRHHFLSLPLLRKCCQYSGQGNQRLFRLPRLQRHHHRSIRAQGKNRVGLDRTAGNQTQPIFLAHRGQDELGFHEGKGIANTLTRAAAKREVGVAWTSATRSGVKRSGSKPSGLSQISGRRWVTYGLTIIMPPF